MTGFSGTRSELQATLAGGIGQGVLEGREVVVTHVLELDERRDLLELDGEAHRVAE